MSSLGEIAGVFFAALAKDLRLLLRDKVGLVFLTVAPILVITIAGFSLASLYGADPRGESAYLLPFVDEDAGELGSKLREALGESDAIEVVDFDTRKEAERELAARDAGVVVIVPEGASEALAAGEEARLLVLTDPVKYLEVANVRAILQEARHQILLAVRREIEERIQDADAEALAFAGDDLPAIGASLEIDEQSATGAPRRLNTFDQNVPGFSVTFLLLGMLLGVSLALLDERDWGTIERLRSTPAPLAVVLVAKLGARFVVGLAQMSALFAVGWLLFGISLGPEPWALALPTAGIVFVATALGLLVAGLARSRDAVLPLGSIVIVTMASVGGCWWPIDLEPRWMREVAQALPTTWAMTAYNDLMIRRQGAEAALLPTAILFAHGALYLVLGVVALRRQLRG